MVKSNYLINVCLEHPVGSNVHCSTDLFSSATFIGSIFDVCSFNMSDKINISIHHLSIIGLIDLTPLSCCSCNV